MSDAQTPQITPTPRHLWVIGVIALLWNAMGAMDFVMTQTRNEDYMKAFTPEQLEYFYGFPMWLVVVWAVGVWGGVLGSLLLLFRKRLAEWVFLASASAVVISTFYNLVLSNGLEIMGDPTSLVFTAVIFLVALFLYFYARAMYKRGVFS